MTPVMWIAVLLAALAIVAALVVGTGWVVDHGDPRAERPRLLAVKTWRLGQRFYAWAAGRGTVGIIVTAALFGAVYLGLCLAAVAVLRAIPGLVP